jgi:hypothetical protein
VTNRTPFTGLPSSSPSPTGSASAKGHRVTTDVAHSILKESLLREPVVTADGEQLFDHRGDPLMRTRSTRELNTVEFNEYLDRCGELLVEMEVLKEMPEPRRYRERITAR